jgi:hypothetical protein
MSHLNARPILFRVRRVTVLELAKLRGYSGSTA